MPDTVTLKLRPVAPQRHERLTIFSLVAEEPIELPYQLLGDAIANETLKIQEVGSGTVPELLAHNTGDVDTLVLDGEQMIGAKQNRMASRTFILPGKSTTRIPVSCMEQGRWHFTSEDFSPAPYHAPSAMRKKVRTYEAKRAKAGAQPSAAELRAAQGDVWAEVHSYERELGVDSPTQALDDVYRGVSSRIEDWIAYFPGVDSQVGLMVFVDGTPLGMDIVGGCGLYARLHERLLRGYVLDALEVSRRAKQPETDTELVDEGAALRFLDRAQKAVRTPAPTVGRGVYHVLSETVVGGELLDDDRLAHRSAFPDESEPGQGRGARSQAPGETVGGGRAEGPPIAGPRRRRHPRQRFERS
jgi:hypothetical protein